ncbi:MAG: DUF3631 domain-containing protein, partial [Mobilicoccus sp.]|nr:DUF3631 domain-containing protein [Mobilicoccus sp.]
MSTPHVLDDVEAAIRRYCVLPSEGAYVAVALWVALSHLVDQVDYAPRLVARSAEKRSGKSRLLEVVAEMAWDPLRTVNASTAYIFRRLVGDKPPTILLDEADTIFGVKVKAEQHEDLRGLLNAGFQRGLTFGRCVGPSLTPTEFRTFSLAALAGIGRMPDTIEDRAVVLRMRRRLPSETVSPYRGRRDGQALTRIREALTEWAEGVDIRADEPDIPAGIEDRAADTWEPLLAVADAVGGAWPARARKACVALVAESDDDATEQSLGVRLLADCRTVWDGAATTFLPSSDLVSALRALDEAPWETFELNPSKLGRRLAEYGIRTAKNTAGTARGYRREDFLDPFERYLPANESEGVQSRPRGSDQVKRSDSFTALDTLKVSNDAEAS